MIRNSLQRLQNFKCFIGADCRDCLEAIGFQQFNYAFDNAEVIFNDDDSSPQRKQALQVRF